MGERVSKRGKPASSGRFAQIRRSGFPRSLTLREGEAQLA